MNPARLTEALLGDDPRLLAAYHTDAEFHAAVEVMTRVLPVLVQLVADDAARSAQQRRLYEQQLRHPPTLGDMKGEGE